MILFLEAVFYGVHKKISILSLSNKIGDELLWEEESVCLYAVNLASFIKETELCSFVGEIS